MTGLRRGARRSQRGLSTSIQYALLTPALVLAVLGIIQTGLWFHGRNVAVQAAQLAADEARGHDPDLAQAQRAARRVTEVGGLAGVDVQIERGPAEVRVVVTAAPPGFVDGLPLPRIRQQASAPVERVSRP